MSNSDDVLIKVEQRQQEILPFAETLHALRHRRHQPRPAAFAKQPRAIAQGRILDDGDMSLEVKHGEYWASSAATVPDSSFVNQSIA